MTTVIPCRRLATFALLMATALTPLRAADMTT